MTQNLIIIIAKKVEDKRKLMIVVYSLVEKITAYLFLSHLVVGRCIIIFSHFLQVLAELENLKIRVSI